MGKSVVVRGVGGSRLGIRLRVVRRIHPLKRRTRLQVYTEPWCQVGGYPPMRSNDIDALLR